jgi:HAD superfamily hydrolase (TIGR01509 family)
VPGPPRAVLFDFNGTLSHDEPIICEIYVELFAEVGVPLSAQEYFDRLAGLSDLEIVETWLGPGSADTEQLVGERVRRYRERVADGSSVRAAVRDAVRYAAERVPVGVVSGAFRAELLPVLEAAGIAELFQTIVTADDVTAGKPDPEGYLRALAALQPRPEPADVLVIEDTEVGVQAATSAGMRCVAILGTADPQRLGRADGVVPVLDSELLARLLG